MRVCRMKNVWVRRVFSVMSKLPVLSEKESIAGAGSTYIDGEGGEPPGTFPKVHSIWIELSLVAREWSDSCHAPEHGSDHPPSGRLHLRGTGLDPDGVRAVQLFGELLCLSSRSWSSFTN